MRFLLLGDIVGKPGRRVLATLLKRFRLQYEVDFVIANGENSAGGSGLTDAIAMKLRKYGVDIVTHGDHVTKKPENKVPLERHTWVIRPANYSDIYGGEGYVIVEHEGIYIGIINAVGNVFLADKEPSPFHTVDDILQEITPKTDIRILDFHAEATSEKIAMGWHLDGRVSAMFGTHTHVQTADERVLPSGTAYITDVGMVGPYNSVIGRTTEAVLKAFVKNERVAFSVAEGDVRMCGMLVDVDPKTGLATHCERVAMSEDDPLAAISMHTLRGIDDDSDSGIDSETKVDSDNAKDVQHDAASDSN